jgi:hypothetical protein
VNVEAALIIIDTEKGFLPSGHSNPLRGDRDSPPCLAQRTAVHAAAEGCTRRISFYARRLLKSTLKPQLYLPCSLPHPDPSTAL